ncbi:MAG: hypothetical protein GY861_23175 [bacterium]|nr:hypothetical protein [bacterium]
MFETRADFREPIIEILRDLGGSAKLRDICDSFEDRYPEVINAPFFQEIVDGEPRWRDWIQRCRYSYLIKEGILDRNSEIGTWTLDSEWL